jgi:hypothetical protein
MNEDLEYELLPYRSTARVWGTIVAGIILFMYAGMYIGELKHGASALAPIRSIINEGHILLFLPWLIAGLGLILAFWKEGLGGGISLVSFIVALFALGFHFTVFIAVGLAAVPSVLYLICWLKTFRHNRK